jgi:hypothetical protein
MVAPIMSKQPEHASTKNLGWVPMLGEFDILDDHLEFKGKLVATVDNSAQAEGPSEQRPGVGLALSSVTLSDGLVSADVEFDAITPDTICELAVAYDSNATHIVTAGLGGEPWAMFGIREFGGSRARQGWWDYRMSGERANLRAQRPYHLEARFRGATVTLSIDGVSVGMAEVASPTGRPRNVGVFCRGNHIVAVRNFAVKSDKPKAFVVMQFTNEYDDVYRDVVREVCKDYEVNVIRADEVNGPGFIIADIVREIATAQLVIADITPANPNVYFEVGYAFALAKSTILLARKGTPLPFDVAAFRVLFYEDTIGGKKKLEDGLRRHLDAILAA